jgi:hypothetical protein
MTCSALEKIALVGLLLALGGCGGEAAGTPGIGMEGPMGAGAAGSGAGAVLGPMGEAVDDPDGDDDHDGLTNAEEARLRTSPILADTDGDGLDDWQEVIDLGFDAAQDPHRFNPRIADVPKIRFDITSRPDITIAATSSTGSAVEYGTTNITGGSESYTTSTTDTTTNSVEMSHEAGASFNPFDIKKSLTLNYGFSHTTTEETSVSYTRETTREMHHELQSSRNASQNQSVSLDAGYLSVLAQLENAGDLAFTLSGLSLTAQHRDPLQRTRFSPIATLEAETQFSAFQDRTVGPGEKLDSMIFSAEIPVNVAQSLLQDPSGLTLSVSSYELENEAGVSFTHSTTTIAAKTATVLIDYGPGQPVERYLVATNVDRDDEGRLEGIGIAEVMGDLLQIPYTLDDIEIDGERFRHVAGIRGTMENADERAYWLINAETKSVEAGAPFDFEDVVLKAGDVLHLVYFRDRDLDGLGAREEFLLGTDDERADTDGDGMNDWDEIREGWTVAYTGEHFYGNPLDGEDYDGDNLNDAQERDAATSPHDPDTDGDTLTDDVDPDNTDGPLGYPGDPIAHFSFDGSVQDISASSHTVNLAYGDGYYGAARVPMAGSSFDWNQYTGGLGPGEDFPLIGVETMAGAVTRDMTLCVWLKDAEYSDAVAGFGDWYGIGFQSGSSTVVFGDGGQNELRATRSFGDGQWHFVCGVARTEGDTTTLELWLDGQLDGSVELSSPMVENPGTCHFYLGNYRADGGACTESRVQDGSIRGHMDDLRVFDRALGGTQIDLLYAEFGYPQGSP